MQKGKGKECLFLNAIDGKQSYQRSKDGSRKCRKPFECAGELLPWLSRKEVGWKRQRSGRGMRFSTRDHLVCCHSLNSSRSMWMPSKYRCLSNTNAFSEVSESVYMKRTCWKYRKLRGGSIIKFPFSLHMDTVFHVSRGVNCRFYISHVTTCVPLRTFIKLFMLTEEPSPKSDVHPV
jgi:hypothetical protein